jgi:hypothetical protein
MGHVPGTRFLFSPHGASVRVGRPGWPTFFRGWPKFGKGGPNLARVAQINIIGSYGGTPGGPHSIIYPITVRNEKGEVSMQKVKVNRYISGKRPEYAVITVYTQSFSESDEEFVRSKLNVQTTQFDSDERLFFCS